jgi:hypothetical protein
VLVFSADFESASDFIGECYIKYEPLSTALPKQKSAEKNCFRGEKIRIGLRNLFFLPEENPADRIKVQHNLFYYKKSTFAGPTMF